MRDIISKNRIFMIQFICRSLKLQANHILIYELEHKFKMHICLSNILLKKSAIFIHINNWYG